MFCCLIEYLGKLAWLPFQSNQATTETELTKTVGLIKFGLLVTALVSLVQKRMFFVTQYHIKKSHVMFIPDHLRFLRKKLSFKVK